MKVYLNDVTHHIMEPIIELTRIYKQLFYHFGTKPNLRSANYERIKERNNEVNFCFFFIFLKEI